MLHKSSSQLGLHPKSTFANNGSSKHPSSVLLLNIHPLFLGPLQDSVNFQKSPSLSPSPISSHHNLPKSKSTATLNHQRKPQRTAEATLSHQNSRRSLGGTPQSYSLLMDYINECKVNNQSHDNSFEHNEHLFSSRRAITENRVVDPEILQLIMNGETEKIFKENRNSLKENSPQTPSVPLIRKKSNERESSKPINRLANREISPVQKKANKSASKRPMSYNETTMRELLKLTSCSSPQKTTKQDSKTKLSNDPSKKVPIFFFNIPEDPADVQKTLTTEDNAAPTFNLRQKSPVNQSPKTKKKASPGKKRSDLTIVSNAMKQYEMFMEGEYTMSLESKRRSSPAKSQHSAESKLHSVEVSTISREDSLRTGVTERDELRHSPETGERLLSELITDYSPALQLSPNDFPRRISSFNPQHSQNDPRKSPPQPKVITRVSSHSQIKNSAERVNSAARTRNSEFSFEMTYFKPIEDSKLDEYIQSVNGSRGQTTTTSQVNSPESSPPKYQPGSIENYQELEKTLNYWQNLCKDLTKTPSKQPPIKMKMGPQNPVIDLRAPKPTRSISNQKPRPPAPTIKSTTTMAKNMVKQTITHQLNLSPLSKTTSKTRLTENKSPLTRKNSRDRSTSIESKKVYENKSVVINTRPSSKSTTTRPSNLKREEEQTYFKLDQLLQVIKTNNNTGTTKDNSRSNSETTSEIGLFQQNTFRSKDIVYVNLTPSKRVYGKNLISNGGTNR